MTWRFAIAILIVTTRSWACSCGGNWPSAKQAWQNAPFVFLGTVEMADPDEDSRKTEFQNQSVRVHVDEAFKGVSNGQTIELHQGASDCDAKFRTGQRAVFYLTAGRTAGTVSVPWCTRALGNAEGAGDDLLFLRGLPKSSIGTRLSGAVELYEDSPMEAFRRVGGIPNVSVKITGSGGLARKTTTNSAGVYEIFGLPPARYSISIEIPKGLKIDFPIVTGSAPVQSDSTAVELASNGGASVDFVLKADTKVSGRMLDADGKAKADLCIDLEPVEGRGENGARFFDCSKKDGSFEMTMMPPGTYWLVAQDEIKSDRLKSKSTLYYPGARDRKGATTISVKAGQYVEDLELRLPRNEKRYNLSGRFQFSDGAPVGSATVVFTSPERGYSETTETSPDGSFGLPVIAGMTGQLSARVMVFDPILKLCPGFRVEPSTRGMIHFMDANPISLSSDSDQQDLKLTLSSPSCKAWSTGR